MQVPCNKDVASYVPGPELPRNVTDFWRRTLRRRSQKAELTLERMDDIANSWLPRPRILHPWPSDRFAVNHPRWEPSA